MTSEEMEVAESVALPLPTLPPSNGLPPDETSAFFSSFAPSDGTIGATRRRRCTMRQRMMPAETMMATVPSQPSEQRNGPALVQPEERDIRAPAPEVPRCVVVLGREFEVNRRHHFGCLAAPVDDPTERALGGVVGERGVRPARDAARHPAQPRPSGRGRRSPQPRWRIRRRAIRVLIQAAKVLLIMLEDLLAAADRRRADGRRGRRPAARCGRGRRRAHPVDSGAAASKAKRAVIKSISKS